MIVKALTGGQAAAEAMRQVNPGVAAAYPITPQTPIIEEFAKFAAGGSVGTEFVCAESEHSALSACVGAQAAGVRAMTATSSQGLALMFEILYVASGLRLPIVMNVCNRALSAPINIHCDHSDTMGVRDCGWLQIFCENPQEVYDQTLLALRLAEGTSLPAMIIQDGFITSHCVERVEVLPDGKVKSFIGEYNPKISSFKAKDQPPTVGPTVLPDHFMEVKKEQMDAIKRALTLYPAIGAELTELTGRSYPLFEEYRLNDAAAALIVSSSAAGTVRYVVDRLRRQGQKVGLLKIRLFRPFPSREIARALRRIKVVGVLDRALSLGAAPPLFTEIKSALFEVKEKERPRVESFVFGLGGRDIGPEDIRELFAEVFQNSRDRV